MTPRRGRRSPWAGQHLSHGLRAVPWVVVTLLLLDVTLGLISEIYGAAEVSPVALAAVGQKLLVVAAAAAVMWRRPRIAMALTALVATLALTVSATGEEVWLLVTIGVTSAVRARPRQLVLVLLGEVAWSVAFGVRMAYWQQDWAWGATLGYLAISAIALAVGLLARRLLHLRDRRQLRVAQLERERTEIRAVERARLADELQAVVSQGLAGIERDLADVDRRRPDLGSLRASLLLVDEHSRSLLGQLGTLLAVLRDDQDADPGPVPSRRRRRLGLRVAPTTVRRLLVALTCLATVSGLVALISFGANPYWYALPAGLLCLLATALLGLRAIWAVLLGVAALDWFLLATDHSASLLGHLVLVDYVTFLAFIIGLVAWHLVTARRDALRQLGDLSHQLAQVESEERGAAARELHDVVAHQLSLTTMLVMASSLSEDPDELSRTLRQIRAMTTAAQDELTALVAGMRGPTADATAPLVAPVATAEALGRRLRESGFDPVLVIDPVADALEPTTQRTLGRIMQEATTNIVRYAPPGSRCEYSLGVVGPEVTLRVASRAVAGRKSKLSLGWGLRGAQERVELTRGTFRAGQEGDQWVLTVILPTTSAEVGAVEGERQPALG